jgi:hypothetical protein
VTLQPTPHDPPDDGRRARRRFRPGWPRLAERVLGGVAPTLRMAALLLTALLAGLTVILAVWGLPGMAIVLLLCTILRRVISRLAPVGW